MSDQLTNTLGPGEKSPQQLIGAVYRAALTATDEQLDSLSLLRDKGIITEETYQLTDLALSRLAESCMSILNGLNQPQPARTR